MINAIGFRDLDSISPLPTPTNFQKAQLLQKNERVKNWNLVRIMFIQSSTKFQIILLKDNTKSLENKF